jgi:hypothetical protein
MAQASLPLSVNIEERALVREIPTDFPFEVPFSYPLVQDRARINKTIHSELALSLGIIQIPFDNIK